MKNFFCVVYLIVTVILSPAFGTVPIKLEPLYSEALLAYNMGQHDKAKRLYSQILHEDPKQIDTLRLKALTHKALQENDEAKKAYGALILISKKEKLAPREYAPYYFELGTLAFHQKDFSQARSYLEKSIDAHFNESASKFFLGVSYFEENKYETARSRFEEVLGLDVDDLKPTSQLYLAQISDKMNDSAGSLRGYVQAREIASQQMNSSLPETTHALARRVMNTADKELRNYEKSTFFGDVGILSGYDSNVLSVPKGTAEAGGYQPASFKEVVSYTLGYSTNPTQPVQFLGTYRGNTNYNFNRDTRSSQYLNQDMAIYLTRYPYRQTNYGFKLGGTGVLQYQVDGDSGRYIAYSLAANAGLFLRLGVGNRWILGMDSTFLPTKNYTDGSVEEIYRRSGWTETTRIYLSNEKPTVYFNPGIYLTGEYAQPNGSEYQSRKLGLDFGNTMYLSSRFIFGQTIGFADMYYPNRVNEIRNDQVFTAALSAGFNVSNELSLLADASYVNNLSNVSNYRYDRWSGSFTGLYRF